MARRRGGGYRAPSHYDPRRGKKPRRGAEENRDDEARPAADRRGGRAGDPTQRRRNGASDPAPRGGNGGSASAHDRERAEARGETRSARVFAFDEGGRPKRSQQPSEQRLSKERGSAERSSERRPSEERPSEERPATQLAAPPDRPRSRGAGEQTSFVELGLGPNIVRTLAELGAEAPFPIQAETVPDIVAGRDLLGRARTGSGKTIAFGAGLVERLLLLKASGAWGAATPAPKRVRGKRQEATKRPPRNPKALILAPTRELALQIDRTVQPIARSVGFYTAQLVGGVPIDPQVHALERGIDIVIGTPGRIQDLVQRRRLDLREVLVTVVDEADHMCELGFLDSVQRILRYTVRDGQRMLFSATLDHDVRELVDEFLRDPAVHEVESERLPDSRHRVFVVLREHKDDVVRQLLAEPGRIIAFCRTRAYAELVAEQATAAGIRAVPLHGDLKQAVRERNLARFAAGKVDVLVATDVAARGIHVDDVDRVVQLDPPSDAKAYVHRAGRTGRAGKTGDVITVIPRTRQKRTREFLAEAGIEPEYFDDFEPGDRV